MFGIDKIVLLHTFYMHYILFICITYFLYALHTFYLHILFICTTYFLYALHTFYMHYILFICTYFEKGNMNLFIFAKEKLFFFSLICLENKMCFQIDIYKLKQNKSYDDIHRLSNSYSSYQKNPNFLENFRALKIKYPLSYMYLYSFRLTKEERLESITNFLNSTRK
jgi:hypothetical protein